MQDTVVTTCRDMNVKLADHLVRTKSCSVLQVQLQLNQLIYYPALANFLSLTSLHHHSCNYLPTTVINCLKALNSLHRAE